MAKAYRLTAKRKVALRKAQLVSARKRKGKGLSSRTKRNVAIGATGVSAAVLLGSGAYARHKISGSKFMGVNSPRENTPMITIAGTQVPGVRAGLRFSNYKNQGFALSYTHRNKSGDKLLFSYRHTPLTREAVSAAFGRKIKGAPQSVTGWKPTKAISPDINTDLVNEINYSQRALTPEGRAWRKVTQSWNSTSRKHMLARVPNIPEIEVMARQRKYREMMQSRGVVTNYLHNDAILKLFREAKI